MSRSLKIKIQHCTRCVAIVLFLFLVNPRHTFAQDSSKIIYILPGSKSLRQIYIDSATTIISLAGNARVRQGKTFISGDSIAINQATGVAEVFGHVHINDADTVNTYANYLKYLGKERIAYLKKNVKLTDGKGTLVTDDLVYNLASGVAKYSNGGRVLNGTTVLTSADAVYYEDTKDVYFKKYVHLTDPEYDIIADSLYYNTLSKEARFISPTRIKTKNGGIINTNSGYYNLATGKSEFYDRTAISDSNYFIIGDKIAYDDKAEILQIENNGKIVDSASNVTVIGDLLYLDKKSKSFLATKKPVLIFYQDGDSTYIAFDTLFSGVRLRDKAIAKVGDTARKKNIVDSVGSRPPVIDNTFEELLKQSAGESEGVILVKDTGKANINFADSTIKKNSPKLKVPATLQNATDTVRYFLGFNHGRIFNDSLQAVCDSLYYSTEDSVFRMYRNPVFWNGQTQVAGDTMYLFTEKRKAKRLYVFNNSIVINKPNESFYNQVGGRTLNGYFEDGNIDYVRVKGSPAESIYYPQDEDSAFIGLNRSTSDVIDAYFVKKQLNKIKFVNQVDGTLYPLRQATEELKKLKNFLWQDKRRPKNKLELFE